MSLIDVITYVIIGYEIMSVLGWREMYPAGKIMLNKSHSFYIADLS